MKKHNTIIETERLDLRLFAKIDTPALCEILKEPQANTFLPWFPIENFRQTDTFFQKHFLDYYNKNFIYRFAICLKANDIPIGYICLADNESNDLGYCVKKEFWHQGIVSEAALAMVARLKNDGFTFITATHDINNPFSGKVMQKIGMTYKYTYEEFWQPKNKLVKFRMYQLNFDGNNERTYQEYWQKYDNHFIENL